MTTRLPALIRQSRVFDLVVQGKTYEQIAKKLRISEDTVARDMLAIAEQVTELVGKRNGEILAVAMAHFQWIIDMAKAEYDADLKREQLWYAGKLDYEHENVVTKTLALKANEEGSGDDDEETPGISNESIPLEVKRTRRRLRPSYSNNRDRWLTIVGNATRDLCELAGLKKLNVEHGGEVRTTPTIREVVVRLKTHEESLDGQR